IHEHKRARLNLGHARSGRNELPGARSAAGHDADVNACLFQQALGVDELLQGLAGTPAAFFDVGNVLEVAVVPLQTVKAQARILHDVPGELQGNVAGSYAAATHADVNLDQDANGRTGGRTGLGNVGRVSEVIDAYPQLRILRQIGEALQLDWPDDLIR